MTVERSHIPVSGESVPQDRDFSIIWTNLPLPTWLFELVDGEKEKVLATGVVSHTEARRLAKEKIERELSDEDYQRAINEIEARPSFGQRAARLLPMRDTEESDTVYPTEID